MRKRKRKALKNPKTDASADNGKKQKHPADIAFHQLFWWGNSNRMRWNKQTNLAKNWIGEISAIDGLSLEQLERQLWGLVGLGQNSNTSLLEDAVFGHCRSFHGDIGIKNTAAGCREIFRYILQV